MTGGNTDHYTTADLLRLMRLNAHTMPQAGAPPWPHAEGCFTRAELREQHIWGQRLCAVRLSAGGQAYGESVPPTAAQLASHTPRPGIEPGSSACQAEILTTILPRTCFICSHVGQEKLHTMSAACSSSIMRIMLGRAVGKKASRHGGSATCLRGRELSPGLPRDRRKY